MSFNSLVLADSPIINLRHEDTSGTVSNDSSGNANHGTYVGTPTLNQRSLLFLPHEGKSVAMGVGKRVTIPAGLITTTTYTYEFLIKPTSVTGVQCLAHDGTNGIYLNGDKLSLYYSATHHDSTNAVVINEKSLLQVVVTAGAVEYFINRVSAGTAAGAPIFSATTLYSEGGGANEIAATVCEFAAYTTAVLAAKIRERYREAFSVGFRKVIANSAPHIHLPMAETVGETTGFDVSGNDLDGTYSNVTLDQTRMLHQMNGGSVLFDGVAGHLLISDNALIQNVFDGGGVAGILLNATSDGEGNAGRLMDKNGWYIDVIGESGGSAKIQFTQLFSTTNGVWESTATDLTLAADDCVMVDYDNTLATNDPVIYIAGQSIALTETSTPVGTRTTDVGSDLYIGNNAAGSATFHGRLSNAFLVPAFTANEPLQINESFKSRYAAEVISYGPLQYLRFNEGGGSDVINYGSYGVDQTSVFNSPNLADADTPITNEDTLTTSANFDGVNDGFRYPTNASLDNVFSGGGTVITFLNVDVAEEAAVARRIYTTRDGYLNTDDGFSVSTNEVGSGYAFNLQRLFSTTAGQWETPEIALNQWNCCAATYDDSLTPPKMFIDGGEVAVGETSTPVGTASTDTGNQHYFGHRVGLSGEYLYNFDGGLAEFTLFTTTLTSPQILDIYEMASYSLVTTTFGITGLITESLAATDFFVRASQLDNGTFIADAVMQGDQTYTFDFSQIAGYETYADEVLLTALPKTGKRRLNSTAYVVGDYYIPADVSTNNHIYKVIAITTGITAASEPVLDQAGGTTVDGGVTVQDRGACPTPQTQIDYAATI